MQPSRRPTCFCTIQSHRLAAVVPYLHAAPVPHYRWGRMPMESTCDLPTSPSLHGPCRVSPKVREGERQRASAGRGRGGATCRRSVKERGGADVVPAGQAVRRQGHMWCWEPAAAAIRGGGARSRARPAPTSKMLSLDVEAARRSRRAAVGVGGRAPPVGPPPPGTPLARAGLRLFDAGRRRE